MEVLINSVSGATVVVLAGDIDGSTAPVAQARILEQLVAGETLILDMTGVAYMSSAGLRMLLSAHRSAATKGGSVRLVGLSEDLQDTMAATGFLEFFSTYPSVAAALVSLGKE
jgi:anti-sigma B factor antagonist